MSKPQRIDPHWPALALNQANPHYFTFRGKPTVLITSGEHYSSVLNLEFDYRAYLDTLHHEGFNHTRLFAGVYRELPNQHWPKNPLGPQSGKFVCPYARSNVPGAQDGGNRFDLGKWDDVFFGRLLDFCRLAGERRIVVEVNLFCPHYEESHWNLSPWNPVNNVNELGAVPASEVYSLKQPKLLIYQEAMVRKIVHELNHFDNLYFETINEPYVRCFDQGASQEWEDHIANFIVKTEADLPFKHLISRNVATGWCALAAKDVSSAVSILNFHYTLADQKSMVQNYPLNLVIGCNETGFFGPNDEPYRIQGWRFMLSGGGLFNHLDASFTADGESGTALPKGTMNFGGGLGLRKQLRILKDFMESFDFVRMTPADNAAIEYSGGADCSFFLLAEEGKQYGLYIVREPNRAPCRSVTLTVPAGKYTVQWVGVFKGPLDRQTVSAADGRLVLEPPEFQKDIALRITASSKEENKP